MTGAGRRLFPSLQKKFRGQALLSPIVDLADIHSPQSTPRLATALGLKCTSSVYRPQIAYVPAQAAPMAASAS